MSMIGSLQSRLGLRLSLLLSIIAAGGLPKSTLGTEPEELVHVPQSTKRVCQLTGDHDRASKRPTLSQTGKRFGVIATDLGSSFEHRGNLFFLFGDTRGRPGDRDVLAWTASRDPTTIVLDFYKSSDRRWLPLTVPGIGQGAFEIPSGGVSIGETIFVVCTTDHSEGTTMGRSVLAVSHDDGRSFHMLYDLSRTKFINVSMWVDGRWLFIYGSGDYRKSNVCLARVEVAHVNDRSRLEFLSDLGPEEQPRWSSHEVDAIPLFDHPQVGEFSVSYLKPVKRHVILYNSAQPRGITLRSAKAPWGPWSAGTIIFEPRRDDGYGHFMHIKNKADGLSDPNRVAEWGGEYGPYIMSRYTSGADRHCDIYYTMSTWNPYQVMVMRSELKLSGTK